MKLNFPPPKHSPFVLFWCLGDVIGHREKRRGRSHCGGVVHIINLINIIGYGFFFYLTSCLCYAHELQVRDTHCPDSSWLVWTVIIIIRLLMWCFFCKFFKPSTVLLKWITYFQMWNWWCAYHPQVRRSPTLTLTTEDMLRESDTWALVSTDQMWIDVRIADRWTLSFAWNSQGFKILIRFIIEAGIGTSRIGGR